MPGRTFDTRPLYKLPTTPRERSRSMNISATRSSSRIATRVSWALEEMIISLVMPSAPQRPRTWRKTGLRRTHQQVRQQDAEKQRDHEQPVEPAIAPGATASCLISKPAHAHVEN